VGTYPRLLKVTGLSGIYTDPGHLVEYTSNGEVRQEFTVVFVARVVDGQATINEEASEVVWIEPDQIRSLPMTQSMTQRIGHYLDGRTYLG
jgi:roadblock/LC7 domain-containing protein